MTDRLSELVSPHFRMSDLVRLGVCVLLSAFIFANRSVFSEPVTFAPTTADQPWITSPIARSVVKAGIVTFEGTGPEGQKVEVLENGRVVGEGVVKSNRWKASGKLFGDGETTVFVRAVGGIGKQSPSMKLTVEGQVPRTLAITEPLDNAFLTPGRVMFKGTGKPGESVELTYNGQSFGSVTVNEEGKWWKAVELYQPAEDALLRADCKGQGEIVEVRLSGTG